MPVSLEALEERRLLSGTSSDETPILTGLRGPSLSDTFGLSSDQPIVGDWNGDGLDEIGVFRDGNWTWYLDEDGDGEWSASDISTRFGQQYDVAIAGRWNNSSESDRIGIFRNGIFSLDNDGSGTWNAGDSSFTFGVAGDQVVIGDWNGDGIDDVGVVREITSGAAAGAKRWFLDLNGDRSWDAVNDGYFDFGSHGDKAIAGDWNADGIDEIGIVRNLGTGEKLWFLDLNGNRQTDAGDLTFNYGVSSEKPVVGRWQTDAVFGVGRFAGGYWYRDSYGHMIPSMEVDENSVAGTVVGTVIPASAGGNNFTYALATGGNAGGLFAINSQTGVVTTTAPLNYEAASQYQVTVVVSSSTRTAQATITIGVNDLNESPLTNNVTVNVDEDSFVNGQVVANDPEGAGLTYLLGTSPADGTATINTDGSFTYTPTANYFGNDSFTVIVSDGVNASTATVSVTVAPVPDPPVIVPVQVFTVPENAIAGTTVGQLLATDADGDALVYAFATGGNAGGLFLIDPQTGVLTTTAPLDFETAAQYVLTVTVSDPSQSTAQSTATIIVTNVNEVPVVSNVSVNVDEDGFVTGHVVATDPEGVSPTYLLGSTPTHGTAIVNADGSFTYTPTGNFFGNDSFTVTVSDGVNTATAVVSVTVAPLPDSPEISPGQVFTVAENAIAGTIVGQLQATDADGDPLTYGFAIGGDAGGLFLIDPQTGVLTTTAPLDFEAASQYVLTLIASDPGQSTAQATVTINVTDVNEAPIVSNVTVNVDEDSFQMGQVVATDPEGALLTYLLDTSPTNGTATVNAGGSFSYTPNLGFIGNDSFNVTVSDGVNTATAVVSVTVAPSSAPPQIAADQTLTISESAVAGTVVGTISGSDPNGGTLTYEIMAGNEAGLFALDSATGQLTTTAPLDHEALAQHTLVIRLTDSNQLWSQALVTIDVSNVDEGPVFKAPDYQFSVSEGVTAGTAVGSVSARDPEGGTVTYEIVSGNSGDWFAINTSTGEITAAIDFDGSSAAIHALVVRASAGGFSSDVDTTIEIIDANLAPVIAATFAFSASEDLAIGSAIGTVTASDAEADPLAYQIIAGNEEGRFTIDRSSGVVTLARPLDYESETEFSLTIRVRDAVGGFADTVVTIAVNDVADEPPIILRSQLLQIPVGSVVGTTVGYVVATDPEAGSLTYSIVGGDPDGIFSIDSQTGEIQLAALPPDELALYHLTVQVSDGVHVTTGTAYLLNQVADSSGGSNTGTSTEPGSETGLVGVPGDDFFYSEIREPEVSLPDIGTVPREYGLTLETEVYLAGFSPSQLSSPVNVNTGGTTTQTVEADGGVYTIITETTYSLHQSAIVSSPDNWTYLETLLEEFDVLTTFVGDDGTVTSLHQDGYREIQFNYSYYIGVDGIVEVRSLAEERRETVIYERRRLESETTDGVTTVTFLKEDRGGTLEEDVSFSRTTITPQTSGGTAEVEDTYNIRTLRAEEFDLVITVAATTSGGSAAVNSTWSNGKAGQQISTGRLEGENDSVDEWYRYKAWSDDNYGTSQVVNWDEVTSETDAEGIETETHLVRKADIFDSSLDGYNFTVYGVRETEGNYVGEGVRYHYVGGSSGESSTHDVTDISVESQGTGLLRQADYHTVNIEDREWSGSTNASTVDAVGVPLEGQEPSDLTDWALQPTEAEYFYDEDGSGSYSYTTVSHVYVRSESTPLKVVEVTTDSSQGGSGSDSYLSGDESTQTINGNTITDNSRYSETSSGQDSSYGWSKTITDIDDTSVAGKTEKSHSEAESFSTSQSQWESSGSGSGTATSYIDSDASTSVSSDNYTDSASGSETWKTHTWSLYDLDDQSDPKLDIKRDSESESDDEGNSLWESSGSGSSTVNVTVTPDAVDPNADPEVTVTVESLDSATDIETGRRTYSSSADSSYTEIDSRTEGKVVTKTGESSYEELGGIENWSSDITTTEEVFADDSVIQTLLSTIESDSSSEVKSSDRDEVEIIDTTDLDYTIKTTAGSDNRRQSKTESKSHDFADLTTTGTPLPEEDPGTGGSVSGSGTSEGSGSGSSIVVQDGREYITAGSEISEFESETNGGFSFAEWSTYTKRSTDADDPDYWRISGGSVSGSGSAADKERSVANVYQTVAERTTPELPSTPIVQGGVPAAFENLPGVIYSSIDASSVITYHADGSITAHSEQTTEDRESFDYQILSGGAAGQAVRGGVTGTGQAVTGGNWFGGLEDSIENGSHDLSIVSTIESDVNADGTTEGFATTTTDLEETSNFIAGANTSAGNGLARHDGTFMSAQGNRRLTLHDELIVTLHADGRESSVHVVERDSFEFSLMKLRVEGGDGGGSGAGSEFTMGYGSVFVRAIEYDLTEETDVEEHVTRDEREEIDALQAGSSHFVLEVTGDGLELSVSGGGGQSRRERVVKENGVKTEYLLGDGTSSSSSMSLDFEYSDDVVDLEFESGSSNHSSQTRTETLTSEHVVRRAGGSSHHGHKITIKLPFVIGNSDTYTDESFTSTRWELDGDYSFSSISRDANGDIVGRGGASIGRLSHVRTTRSETNYSDASHSRTTISGSTDTHTGSGSGIDRDRDSYNEWTQTDFNTGSGGCSNCGSGGSSNPADGNTTTSGDTTTSGGSSSGSGSSLDPSEVINFLTGEIDFGLPIPGLNSGMLLANIYDLLVSVYGSWEAVPEDLRELIGGDSDQAGGLGQGNFQSGWLDQLYRNLFSTKPLAGTQDPVRNSMGSDSGTATDPYYDVPFNSGEFGGSGVEPVEEKKPTGEGSGDGSGTGSLSHAGFGATPATRAASLAFLYASLGALTDGVGHHWVPQSVYSKLQKLLNSQAYVVFDTGYSGAMDYIHGFDTWNNVTHRQYNGAVAELLKAYHQFLGGNKRLNQEQAQAFLEWIRSGTVTPLIEDFAATRPAAYQLVKKWRAGFAKSMGLATVILEKAEAMGVDVNDPKFKRDVKRMIQNIQEGRSYSFSGDSWKVYEAMREEFNGLSPAAKKAWIRRFGKIGIAATVLGLINVPGSAMAGYHGEDAPFGLDGLDGAALNVSDDMLRDLVWAEEIETYAFPTVKQEILAPVFNRPSISLPERFRRSGVSRWDLHPSLQRLE